VVHGSHEYPLNFLKINKKQKKLRQKKNITQKKNNFIQKIDLLMPLVFHKHNNQLFFLGKVYDEVALKNVKIKQRAKIVKGINFII